MNCVKSLWSYLYKKHNYPGYLLLWQQIDFILCIVSRWFLKLFEL